jgi:hypothetical protein
MSATASVGIEECPDQRTPEEQFLEECCERDPESWVRPSRLYRSYLTWCEENDLAPLSLNQIAHRKGLPSPLGS